MTVLFLAAEPTPISTDQVYLILAAGVAGWALLYAAACWIWPFAQCWRCERGRRYQNEKRKTWRPCRWCKGSGRRLRVGRWIYNRSRGNQRGQI